MIQVKMGQEWNRDFSLKIKNFIEKYFKQKLYKIKFPTKNSVGACL